MSVLDGSQFSMSCTRAGIDRLLGKPVHTGSHTGLPGMNGSNEMTDPATKVWKAWKSSSPVGMLMSLRNVDVSTGASRPPGLVLKKFSNGYSRFRVKDSLDHGISSTTLPFALRVSPAALVP